MSNSSLTSVTILTDNHSGQRNHAIDTITIHCMAGDMSAEGCGYWFKNGTNAASSNYGVDSDGKIGLYVEECNRSWASSSRENDHRAVTIEVANDGGESTGWHVSGKAYAALIELVADICKRNGIEKLVWRDTPYERTSHLNGANMTVHRDFVATACPGEYLFTHMADIADKVNQKLKGDSEVDEKTIAEIRKIVKEELEAQRKTSDVVPKWAVASGEWVTAINMGITDGTRPNDPVTRVEAAAMVVRAKEIADE